MAPRRGGGSGGGSGSDGFLHPSWGESYQFSSGSHFHDPNERAVIVILGICFVATCVIAPAIPTRSRNSYKWPSRMWPLWLSIIMSIIYVGNTFADSILISQDATVALVYFLISTIINLSVFVAEISLFGFIYILTAACLQEPGAKAQFKNTLRFTSRGIIIMLSALFAAILALKIKYQVNYVINLDKIGYNDVLTWSKIEVAYDAALVSASIEILVFAVLILLRARKGGNPILIGAFLVSMIAIPQLIRSLFELGFDTASLTRSVGVEATVAAVFFKYMSNVVIYLGIVLVLMQFKKEQQIGMGSQEKPGLPQMNPGPWQNPTPGQQQEYNPHGPHYSTSPPNPTPYASFPNGPSPYVAHPQYPSHPTSPPNGYYSDNPRSPTDASSTASAYQAQTQYNNNNSHAHHSPVSPILREKSPVSPVLRESGSLGDSEVGNLRSDARG